MRPLTKTELPLDWLKSLMLSEHWPLIAFDGMIYMIFHTGQSLEGACGGINDMPDSQRQQVLPDLENVTPVRKREAETKATPARTVSSSKDKLKVGFATPVLDKSSDQRYYVTTCSEM